MSRMAKAVLLGLTLIAAPGYAQRHVSAERALQTYRDRFKPPAGGGCAKEADGDAIVVCGRRPGVDPNRLPLPAEREAGERIQGEPAVPGHGCLRSCYQPVQADLIKTVPKVVDGIKKILDP